MFESYPDFTDNTYPVYLELKKRLPDYKMIWGFHGTGIKKEDVLTVSAAAKSTLFQSIKRWYCIARSKAIVTCNYIKKCVKIKPRQISLFLDHGSPTKDITGMRDLKKLGVDFINLQSHFFDKPYIDAFSIDAKQLVYLGYPRCDWFYRPSRRKDIDGIVKGKYIVWLPTFRSNKDKNRDDAPGSVFSKIGVPLFYSIDALKEFDAFLRGRGISILYKPHFVQDMDVVRKTPLSNFIMIGDRDILGRGLQLYEVLAQSEALITDYSSVFWDYMLLDRPIAVTTDDIKEYKAGLGVMGYYETISGESAEVAPNAEALREFIANVADGRDVKREGRRKWRDIANMYQDGKSSERAADFIMEKLGIGQKS